MNHTPNYQLNQWEAGDKVQRVDFNADNAKIDAAIAEKVSIITGAYTGDQTASRVIDLGCQPKAVLLMRYDGETYFNNYIFGGLILPGYPLRSGSEVVAEIVSNGFRVVCKGSAANTNTNTDYHYIAFV